MLPNLGQNWEPLIVEGLYGQPRYQYPISLQSLSKTKDTYNHETPSVIFLSFSSQSDVNGGF